MREQLKNFGNLNQLLAAIKKANRNAGTNCSISRHAVEKLIHNPSQVSLSMSNLAALHTFLTPYDEGLDQHPILERALPINWLARSLVITWLLASKPNLHARHEDISAWDFRSQNELQSTLHVHGARPKNGNEIFLVPPRSEHDATQKQKIDHLIDGGTHSLISIGSPLACPSSEMLLARMFGVEPFSKPSLAHRLPFYFLWPPHCTQHLQSSFALPAEALPSGAIGDAIRAGKASALQVGDQLYQVLLNKNKYILYGIIVAQRRCNGEVWVVLAGLSGPATLAAARLFRDIPAALPATPGRNAPILFAVVEADVVVDDSVHTGENRSLSDCRLVGTPQLWPTDRQSSAL